MILPELTEMPSSKNTIDVFGGYNHNLRISDGEFYAMTNLTSDNYPVLSTRQKRSTYLPGDKDKTHNYQALIGKDALCYVDNDQLFINESKAENITLRELNDGEKRQLISMGAYLIIMPDKKWINTANTSLYGNIEAIFEQDLISLEEGVEESVKTATFTLCKADGTGYTYKISSSEPEEPSADILWYDISTTPNTLKQYSTSNKMWSQIATTYIKINLTGIGTAFNTGDAVTISGIKSPALSDLNNTMVIQNKIDDDNIVVVGIIDDKYTQDSGIKIERLMPRMDYICECNNRLWGCRYGTNNKNEVVNEIYACKQGDFKNWFSYQGISTDSYALSIGSDGKFTGAVNYLGYPLFFKENFIHKIYGTMPSNYQLQTTTCRGVQDGSSQSLAIVNEILYYKSSTDICAYDGSLPVGVSANLGNIKYKNAVACSHNNKYFISMEDENHKFHLFVYDSKHGLWHREDNIKADTFCSIDNELYFIENNKIRTEYGSVGTLDTEAIEWDCESGVIGISSADKKSISRISVRLNMELGSNLDIFVQYDSCGQWEHICNLKSNILRTFTLPIRPKRCDHLKLKFVGKGEAKLYSITYTSEEGSDI